MDEHLRHAPVRLVATDLDGTLLRADGTVSERTRRVLGWCRAAGIVVVLVTARPPQDLHLLARAAGVSGLAICSNGAIVYDLDRDTILRHAPLRAEVARRLIAALRAAAPGVCFVLRYVEGWGWEPGYAELDPAVRAWHGSGGREGDALALCDVAPVGKLIARHPHLPAAELLAVAREVVGEAAHATHSGAPFVEISAAGVHKAWALERLCAELGVGPAEVVAFGDMPNDLPMLAWAGRGVAVANAHPDVLAAADAVTLSNEEDGVAVALERLLRSQSSDGG